MTCWYVYGEKCERHGRCQGCEIYDKWHEERMRMFGMHDDKMKKGDK